jgi:hypothetical protein
MGVKISLGVSEFISMYSACLPLKWVCPRMVSYTDGKYDNMAKNDQMRHPFEVELEAIHSNWE